MGNCSAYMEPQNASGDIVGYGTLAAFLGSAVMTITAVLFAYYYDAMDDDLLTEKDHQLKRRMRRIISGEFGENATQHSDNLAVCDGVDTQTNLREHRKACFTQFILALSDQQLVTGLAILITTLSSRERLSTYEFSVAHSLAWFSSTTHLATLDVLTPTLRYQNRWVLIGRITGMICVVILLLCTSYHTTFLTDRIRIRPHCCDFIPMSFLYMIQSYFAFMIICSGYIYKLSDLSLWYGLDAFPWTVRFLPRQPRETRLLTPRQNRAKRLANHRYDKIWETEQWHRRIRCSRAIWDILEYNQAFFSTIPAIFFSLSYGISQVVDLAFLSAPNVTKESREMGFGQLMALFLILLPFFAAGESYSGECWKIGD
ncbi:hypothetical protein CGCSCA4_v006806 [Colletotrichum siamense]|uniref:Uncharacterized protein n=1 Tax=Colletotrichum siamense TaxID=690259 RepID=A0A9P5EVH1_COLSI|nr:hypothetical protein CGCSCA4_v006806 [Colletotrichum siamense]KAF4860843.1 hypothetical protein CGCSCA2_v005094 [Colletotrichum siamense]